VNHHDKGGRPQPLDSPLMAARSRDVDSVPSAQGRPLVREMERPRTESYAELWQRACVRMRRF
jgi:hypothetical protein